MGEEDGQDEKGGENTGRNLLKGVTWCQTKRQERGSQNLGSMWVPREGGGGCLFTLLKLGGELRGALPPPRR